VGPPGGLSNPKNPGGFTHGSSFLNKSGPGSAIYDYPNRQSSRFAWYHDHAYGVTRLNAYAGLASAFLITDDEEARRSRRACFPTSLDIPSAFRW